MNDIQKNKTNNHTLSSFNDPLNAEGNKEVKAQLKTNIIGFDYLRAIGCLMVVIAHSDGLRILAINQTISQVFLFYYTSIGLLAVPIFFQVSLYLFYVKRKQKKNYFIEKRLPKVLRLYIFWTCLFMLAKIVVGDLDFYDRFGTFPHILGTIITGGKGLFYFFFSLLFLSFLADLSIAVKERFKIPVKKSLLYANIGFILSCVYLIAVSTVSLFHYQYIWTAYDNPLNFLPYIFSAYLIFHRASYLSQQQKYSLKKEINRVIIPLAIAFILCVVFEWKYFHRPDIFIDGIMPLYARPSLVFGSTALVYSFILLPLKPIPIVSLLSSCSLGIYCFHKFLPNFLGIGLNTIAVSLFNYNLSEDIALMSSILCLNWLFFSIMLTILFRKIKLFRQVL
jgi:surface polysaccharide O-acyltransferase-like enzyme